VGAFLPDEFVFATVHCALKEDIRGGDVTTLTTVPANAVVTARMVAREPLVLCGVQLALEAFQQRAPRVKFKFLLADGASFAEGGRILTVRGPARAILSAERVALNFVQRLSGIATLTARFVKAVRGTRAAIYDTRKTTPGLRILEKYAVLCGGGRNHRLGLHDQILIKDNHLAALRGAKPNAIAAAVHRARKRYPKLLVEVEADSLAQVRQAVAARADIILLDNMPSAQLRAAVKLVRGRALTEASGGVNLRNVRAIAATGVDRISVGALTHSAPAVDIALDFED
jgi:nicotinate-nucleotide pyrophosphorylase (carboxylating)